MSIGPRSKTVRAGWHLGSSSKLRFRMWKRLGCQYTALLALALKRAKAQGKVLGRPRIDEATEKAIRRELNKGTGIRAVARKVGVGVGTVQRVKADQAA